VLGSQLDAHYGDIVNGGGVPHFLRRDVAKALPQTRPLIQKDELDTPGGSTGSEAPTVLRGRARQAAPGPRGERRPQACARSANTEMAARIGSEDRAFRILQREAELLGELIDP
jgi:hypothetical protein